MNEKFAKALAENIGTIAECTAHVVAIDNLRDKQTADTCDARVAYLDKIKKAKANIASILQQPGAWPEPVKEAKAFGLWENEVLVLLGQTYNALDACKRTMIERDVSNNSIIMRTVNAILPAIREQMKALERRREN